MDLWDAGQDRIVRENRGRLVELYTGVRDGLMAADVAVGRVKTRGDITPSYAQPSPEQRRAEAKRGLAQLARDLGGQVVRGEREVIQ